MIDIQNATKTYGDKTAVSDFTAHVESGKITGFIGPNGAGKTTLIRMITGVLKPDAGSVTLDGKNIQTQPLEAKRTFGFVPDSPDLLLRLTGREYADFMADVYKVSLEERRERLEKLAAEFEMTDALDTRMSDYSHGMRQKAIIIGALMSDPDIWILDEPMTGLDPGAAWILKQKMKEHASRGKTVFFSTHVLEVAEKLCDRILLINQGKLKYDGTLEQLQEQNADKTLEEIFLEVTGRV
ncbi:ABC transporter ATP-binding protein [Faecalibaculum rodentium]|jgi:ABC-2 type transport system ATP-binding protein|uniref:ABC transporter ATP-binding protein n=1 Tax=Faecalibaculum rodentium TaxID=1702221 RepID=UPI00259B6E06|nr:ABC transporter ATP-binding protein [Faecalibaculum rodentium]